MGKSEGTPRKTGNWKKNVSRKEESDEESDEKSSRSKPNRRPTNVPQHSNSKSSSSKSSNSNRPNALKIKPRNRGNSEAEVRQEIFIPQCGA